MPEYTITLANVMAVLTDYRRYAPHDAKTTRAAIQAELEQEKVHAGRYTLESVIDAIYRTSVILSPDEAVELGKIHTQFLKKKTLAILAGGGFPLEELTDV